MTLCPACGSTNIEGVDYCDACGQTLSHLDLPVPATEVEKSVTRDRLSTLQPRAAVTCGLNATVAEVLAMLVAHSLGCVLVVDHDGQLVGVFSERDALHKINCSAAEMADRPVSELMTAAPQSLHCEDKIAYAIHKMNLGGYRHVPLIDEQGRPTGVVSARDILRYFTGLLASNAS